MRPCQRQDRLRSWGPKLLTRHRRRDGLHARQCDRLGPPSSSTARSSAAPVPPRRPPASSTVLQRRRSPTFLWQRHTLFLRRPAPASLAPLPLRRQSRDRLPAGGMACGPASAKTACVIEAPICLPVIVATACMLDIAIVYPSSSTARSSAAAASARVLDGTVAPLKPSYLPTAAAHAVPAATSTCVPRAATAAPSEPQPPTRWRHDMRPCQRLGRLRSWGPKLLTRHRRRDGLHARQCVSSAPAAVPHAPVPQQRPPASSTVL